MRLLLLKIDDAAVLGNVDGEAFPVTRLDFAVDSLVEPIADFVELLVEGSFLSLVWLQP